MPTQIFLLYLVSSVILEFFELLFFILLALNWRSALAKILLKDLLTGFVKWSTIPFLIGYICHNVLWWISFAFLLKIFMKGTVYLVLPITVVFRMHRFYSQGSPLHQFQGGPITIKKPKVNNTTGFPSKFEDCEFGSSKTHEYIIPQHFSDVFHWRRWLKDGAWIDRQSGKGRIARKPFASGGIRDAFYLILDNEPGKLLVPAVPFG